MDFPDVDFESTSVEEMTRLFFANSCILLRNFTDPANISALRTILHGLYEELGHFHVYEQEMLDRQHANLSSYVFSEKHRDLLRSLFGSHPFDISYHATCARRVSAPNAKEKWQAPLGFHIDAGFHTLAFTVNFWVPFQSCGVDSPSLAVVAAPIEEMLEFNQFDGKPQENRGAGEWMFHHFNPLIGDAANNKPEAKLAIDDHFGERMWKPEYRPGDAMLISNYTLHGTHATLEMTKSREGMELRFSSDASLAAIMDEHRLVKAV